LRLKEYEREWRLRQRKAKQDKEASVEAE